MPLFIFHYFPFSPAGRPIAGMDSECSVTYDAYRGRFVVVHSSATCVLLASDIRYLIVTEIQEKAALAKSLGRAAYIGAVSGLWRSPGRGRGGAGLSAAMADLALNGAQKKNLMHGLLCFKNGVVLRFEALPEKDLEDLCSSLSPDAVDDEAIENVKAMLSRRQAYLADGEKVVDELFSDICKVCSEMALKQKNSQNAPKFEQRATYRRQADECAANLRVKSQDLAVVCHFHNLNLQTLHGRSDDVPIELRTTAQAAVLRNAVIVHDVASSFNASKFLAEVAYRDPKREVIACAHKKFRYRYVFIAALVATIAHLCTVEVGSISNEPSAVSRYEWLLVLAIFVVTWWAQRRLVAWAILQG